MGAIISFFRPAPTTQGAWSQQELAEFYRVEAALLRAGMRTTCEQGLSDEDDPWFVFCRPTGDVIMHFARIDGSYVIASEALDQPVRGPDFRSLLNQIAAQYPTLLPIPRAEPGAKLVVHPAALLTAIIAAAALSLSPDEAFASGIASAEADGPVPPPSPGGPGEPPSRMAEERGAEPHEPGDQRRQIEAIVFSAMLFAAQTASVDDLGPRTNPELSATKQTSHTADHAAQGDLALPPVPAAGGGRAPDPAAQSAPSPAPALERQAHKDATPSGAEHVSVIQQSRPDFGFEGPDFPKLPAADHPAGLKLDGARHVRSAETGHPRSATERASTDHRPAETASTPDGSAEVKQTSAAPASPPAAPAPVASTTAVSTPAGSTEESGSKVQQSAAQSALQVTAEAPAASELRFDTARVLPRPDPKPVESKAPAIPGSETGPVSGPAIETPSPAQGASSSAASPVRNAADSGSVLASLTDGSASHQVRSQSPSVDRSEPVLRTASDPSGAEMRGTKAEDSPNALAAVEIKIGEAWASPAQAPAAAGKSPSGVEHSRPVEISEAKVAGSDAPAPKADGSPSRPGIESAKAEPSTPSADHPASSPSSRSSHGPTAGTSAADGGGAGDQGSPETTAAAAPTKAGAEVKAADAAPPPTVTTASGQTIAGSDQSRGETANPAASAHHAPSGDLTPPAEAPTTTASPAPLDATGAEANAPGAGAAAGATAPDPGPSAPVGTIQAQDGTGANHPGADASSTRPVKASTEATGAGQPPADEGASGPPSPATDGSAPVEASGSGNPSPTTAPAAAPSGTSAEARAPETSHRPADSAAPGQSQGGPVGSDTAEHTRSDAHSPTADAAPGRTDTVNTAAAASEPAPAATGAASDQGQVVGSAAPVVSHSDQGQTEKTSPPPPTTSSADVKAPETDPPATDTAASGQSDAAVTPTTAPGTASAETSPSRANGAGPGQSPSEVTPSVALADTAHPSSPTPGTDKPSTVATPATPSQESTEVTAIGASQPPAEDSPSGREPHPAAGGSAPADASGTGRPATPSITSAAGSATNKEAEAPEASHPPADSAAPGTSQGDAATAEPTSSDHPGAKEHGSRTDVAVNQPDGVSTASKTPGVDSTADSAPSRQGQNPAVEESAPVESSNAGSHGPTAMASSGPPNGTRADAKAPEANDPPAHDGASDQSQSPSVDASAPAASHDAGDPSPKENAFSAASTKTDTGAKASEAATPQGDRPAADQGRDQPAVKATSETATSAGQDHPGSDAPGATTNASSTAPGQAKAETGMAGDGSSPAHGDISDQSRGETPSVSAPVQATHPGEQVASAEPPTPAAAPVESPGSGSHSPTTGVTGVPSETSIEAKASEVNHRPADGAAHDPSQSPAVDASPSVDSLDPGGHGTTPLPAAHAPHGQEAVSAQPISASGQSGATITGAPEAGTTAGADHADAGVQASQATVSPSRPSQASTETGADGADASQDGTVAGQSRDAAGDLPGPVHGRSAGGHPPGGESTTAAVPAAAGDARPEVNASGTGASSADGAGAGTGQGTTAHPGHPAVASEPPEAVGPGSLAAPSGGTSSPASSPTPGGHGGPASHGANATAQPSPAQAAIGPDGTLVFPADARDSGRPTPGHAEPDADMHTEVGLVGIAHHHDLPHHPDWH